MLKAKKYDWKDSNLALFGTDTDRQVKKESAETEKAWLEVPTLGDSLGTLIWRIVKFKVEQWPKEDYGKFYSGDSYIIYHQRPRPDNPDVLDMHIHFWIGKESSQDEYGTAAYKTVELDTLLDDKPVQHREVQGHETDLFKSYFDHITLMKGGADSGFRKVTPVEYKPRLFKVCRQANKKVLVTEIALSRKKISSDDVFILDNGLDLYQFNGNACSNDERFRAAQYLSSLSDSRNGKPKKQTLDEDDIGPNHEFYTILDEGDDDDDDDDDETDGPNFTKTLFKLSDEHGSLEFKEMKSGPVSLKDFQPQDENSVDSDSDIMDVFIYDTGSHCFVWIGSAASEMEKKNGLSYAHKYLMSTKHPVIPITVVKDGNETDIFLASLA